MVGAGPVSLIAWFFLHAKRMYFNRKNGIGERTIGKFFGGAKNFPPKLRTCPNFRWQKMSHLVVNMPKYRFAVSQPPGSWWVQGPSHWLHDFSYMQKRLYFNREKGSVKGRLANFSGDKKFPNKLWTCPNNVLMLSNRPGHGGCGTPLNLIALFWLYAKRSNCMIFSSWKTFVFQ